MQILYKVYTSKKVKREKYLQRMVKTSVLRVHSKELNFLHTHLYTFDILGENILSVSIYQNHLYLQDIAMLRPLKTVDIEAHQYT